MHGILRFAAVFSLLLYLSAAPAFAAQETQVEMLLPEDAASSVSRDGLLAGAANWLENEVRDVLDSVFRAGFRSAALLVLAALICGAAEGIGVKERQYLSYCGVLASGMIAAGDLRTLIGLGAQTVEELGTLARLLLPTLASAMAAGGFVTSASVWQVTTLLVCDALCSAASKLLLPLSYCCIASAAAGAAMEESALERLSDGIRRLAAAGLKLTLAAFTAYLTIAGVLTGSTDRAAIKAAKLAVSGAVPIVGGVLSDAAESVFAAAGTLRGTVGALGVFAVLTVCLAPLLRLGAQYMIYKLAALAAGLVGTKALGDFLDRMGEAFALVLAVTASCAVVLLASLLVALAILTG
ncbi:MAG: stage III sporulation protein AE [Oscillospiraceae bacterium]|nr:stage III sporulation protein AE [Oscillospiraceae bacterium]